MLLTHTTAPTRRHGDEDHDVPVAAGRWLAERIGKSSGAPCTAEFVEGESHTLIRRNWLRILESVVGTANTTIASL